MDRNSSRVVLSLGLIGFGIVILLNNLNLLPFDIEGQNWFWVAVFGLIGLSFGLVFFNAPQSNWWAIIPSFTMLGLALVVGDFFPEEPRDFSWIGPAVFLGMIGLSFLVILFTRPEQWWAIIPGGTLLSVAGVVAASSILRGQGAGFGAASVLFLGLALTFLMVYFRPVDGQRMAWALWPAGILGLMGALTMFGFSNLINYVWALGLIVIGLVVILRGMRR